MLGRTWVNPKCYYCGKGAYKVRFSDNRLVCRECEHKD